MLKLIIVTRIEEHDDLPRAQSEWNGVWGLGGFPPEYPSVVYVSPTAISPKPTTDALLVLIHGAYYGVVDHPDLIKDVVDAYKSLADEGAEVCIAIHKGGNQELSPEERKDYRNAGIPVYITKHGLGSTSGARGVPDNVRNLSDIVRQLSSGKSHSREDAERALRAAIGGYRNRETTRPLSHLKHAIAHCFLSIDLDLQLVERTWRSGNRLAARQQFQEILMDRNKSVRPYTKSYEQLFRLIAGSDDGKGNGPYDSAMAGPTSVLEAIRPHIRENVKEAWSEVLEVCELEFDRKQPYDSSSIFRGKDGAIQKFLMSLDKAAQDWEKADPIKVLGLSDPGTADGESEVTRFHRWFEQLIESLGKVRDQAEFIEEPT